VGPKGKKEKKVGLATRGKGFPKVLEEGRKRNQEKKILSFKKGKNPKRGGPIS